MSTEMRDKKPAIPDYVKPEDVLGPKRSWQLFHVLFDGGPSGTDLDQFTGTSLAIGRWEGKPKLAIRWNGSAENRIGNPQSRGVPTWFILPDHDAVQILQSPLYNFSDSKMRFARDFLELRRVSFLTHCATRTCSNFGKLVLLQYPIERVPELLADLQNDALKFYCIYCDQQWLPTADEKKRLMEIFKTSLTQHSTGR
jgi:hypothetical protein